MYKYYPRSTDLEYLKKILSKHDVAIKFNRNTIYSKNGHDKL